MALPWREPLLQQLKTFPGHTSFYFKDLVTGETVHYNDQEPMTAASVIKLTVMAEFFRQVQAGELDPKMPISIRDDDRVPICGVLTLMHTGLTVTPEDLCWLMITISDNMATNMLIELLTVDKIQANVRALGLEGVVMGRKFFETRPEWKDKSNFITAAGIGRLLELIWRGELVSPEASKKMMEMLLAQQCTNKIPLLLPGEELAAHKTGECTGVTHDVGILLSKRPCIVCFCNWQLTPGSEGRMNLLIGELTRTIWDCQGGLPAQD